MSKITLVLCWYFSLSTAIVLEHIHHETERLRSDGEAVLRQHI